MAGPISHSQCALGDLGLCQQRGIFHHHLHRAHYFGVVINGTMALTPIGQAAQDCWNEISAHFPFVVLGVLVVLPNHVHGILIIDKPVTAAATPNRFGPQSRNLASIVRGYKIGVTKFARQNDLPFAWQDRYHDHVIRNADEYHRHPSPHCRR